VLSNVQKNGRIGLAGTAKTRNEIENKLKLLYIFCKFFLEKPDKFDF
jgi:hypothetical protein